MCQIVSVACIILAQSQISIEEKWSNGTGVKNTFSGLAYKDAIVNVVQGFNNSEKLNDQDKLTPTSQGDL